ncbi:MAG: hypothetical protein CMI14_11670 [Oleispira sp.]|nr:hypothetical protein [Oleispira sp.]|tara:strand:+ start:590 stop:961 length:372 start_codon:yes stop_codon:yes gene_type:complete
MAEWTHESTTDPEARLFRKGKGKEAKLCFMGHLLTENRNGLIVDAEACLAGTSKEWDSSISLLANQSARPGQTVSADKGYNTNEFVEGCRELKVTPHVAATIFCRYVNLYLQLNSSFIFSLKL